MCSFLVNPPIGLAFPRIGSHSDGGDGDEAHSSFLSRLGSLACATVSSAELSPASLLQSLPPTLWTLEILAFREPFPFHRNLLVALRDRGRDFGALEQWRVTGSDWAESQVRDVTDACEARHIRFAWAAATSEGETASWSTASSTP